MGGYYLENLYKADPDHPVRQALSTRHNFRVIMEKLNATIAVVNNLVIRNNIVYTYIESVDATHPFEIDFHIPTAMDAIKKISLTLKGVPFRAYAKSAMSGGVVTSLGGGGFSISSASDGAVSSQSGGGETSGMSAFVGGLACGAVGDYITILGSGYVLINTTAAAALSYHTHTTLVHTHTGGLHIHGVARANHTHTGGAHTHEIAYGIYESTTPTTVNGYYDDGGGYSGADSYGNAPDTTTPWNIRTEYDITDKYSGTGWKRLKLDTSRLGRFNIILMIEVDLTPTA